MRKTWIVTAAAAGIGALGLLPSPGTASPASGTTSGTTVASTTEVRTAALLCSTKFVADGVRIRLKASLSSTILGLGYPGQWFDIEYITESGGAWFAYGTNRSTGVKGFVYDSSAYLDINLCP